MCLKTFLFNWFVLYLYAKLPFSRYFSEAKVFISYCLRLLLLKKTQGKKRDHIFLWRNFNDLQPRYEISTYVNIFRTVRFKIKKYKWKDRIILLYGNEFSTYEREESENRSIHFFHFFLVFSKILRNKSKATCSLSLSLVERANQTVCVGEWKG